jgi:hypothetical protein
LGDKWAGDARQKMFNRVMLLENCIRRAGKIGPSIASEAYTGFLFLEYHMASDHGLHQRQRLFFNPALYEVKIPVRRDNKGAVFELSLATAQLVCTSSSQAREEQCQRPIRQSPFVTFFVAAVPRRTHQRCTRRDEVYDEQRAFHCRINPW